MRTMPIRQAKEAPAKVDACGALLQKLVGLFAYFTFVKVYVSLHSGDNA